MSIYFRQVCLVADTLEPVIADLKAVFSLKTAYVDPHVRSFGLENTLLAIGTDFIEVVAPIEENTAAGRYLERRDGDGGYMVIGQVETKKEQDACRARASDNGVRVAWETDGDEWKIMQLHPGDMRAAFFEVDWQERFDPEGFWLPAGGDGWQDTISTDVVSAIVGIELQGPDPQALAQHWADVAGVSVGEADGSPIVELANNRLRFVPDTDGRRPGLSGIDLQAFDRDGIIDRAKARGLATTADSVTIGGVHFRLVD
ncbi:VOC family protein [Parasphingopyxis sp. CP4]|uniref:VOC family protein n=1 Tax=Parasphingopyxis sp. CP4 TaxID=2724527 RepID=UPI0015A3DF96|nr:VOC family protein [Parasphingopyxis sp. CP4]QLC20986.1 VOC family protein [Parasphingopyxis sp. CP4]